MKNFIILTECHFNQLVIPAEYCPRKILVNINHIVAVTPDDESSLFDGHGNTIVTTVNEGFIVEETIEEINDLLRE